MEIAREKMRASPAPSVEALPRKKPPPSWSSLVVTGARGKKPRKLLRRMMSTVDTWSLIEPDDRVMVCLSGGKDSYTLLAALYELKWRGLLPVDLLACNLDQGAHPPDP